MNKGCERLLLIIIKPNLTIYIYIYIYISVHAMLG